jgi:hypothetical protein
VLKDSHGLYWTIGHNKEEMKCSLSLKRSQTVIDAGRLSIQANSFLFEMNLIINQSAMSKSIRLTLPKLTTFLSSFSVLRISFQIEADHLPSFSSSPCDCRKMDVV